MPECASHPGNLVPGCRWCRAGITDDTRGRLVVRTADMRDVPGPGTVVEACAVCLRPVYVDRVATPDPPGESLALVCTVCALESPDTRPQVLRLLTAALRLGSVLPPAEKGARRRFAGYLEAQRRSMLSREGKGRDVTRPELVEKYGFDTKFAAHMVRLGFQGRELLKTGSITLPMPFEQRGIVREIRTGGMSMEACLNYAAELERQVRELTETSPLRAEPDRDAADAWLISAYQRAWKERGLT